VDVRLVVADLDGTLLAPDGTVPEETWALIDELHRRGIVFAPASGRQYATLRGLFERVADGMVFIAENGSVVVRDGAEPEVTPLGEDVPAEGVRRVRALAADGVDVGVVRCSPLLAHVERSDDAFLTECSRYYAALEVVDDLDDLDALDGGDAGAGAGAGATCVKLAVHDFGDVEVRTAPELLELSDRARVVVSGRHWTDVQSPEADKGVALRRLQASLGVSRAQTVVFGDYLNDLGLFAEAGLGVAMANAHPDVLAVADRVAPSNAENGVAVVLRELLGSPA